MVRVRWNSRQRGLIVRIVLVYQAGIANVFKVDSFNMADDGTMKPEGRNPIRLLQHAFDPCYWYARGLAAAGCPVMTASCNRAGDIANQVWTEGLDDCPFRDKAKIVLSLVDRGNA